MDATPGSTNLLSNDADTLRALVRERESAPALRQATILEQQATIEQLRRINEGPTCPRCGKSRKKIGEEVGEQLDYTPASLFVIQHPRGCGRSSLARTATPPDAAAWRPPTNPRKVR
ncbi:MAG: IS66 family transposase zinc-finger binding domain-containing protein [Phycisphaeraceae bacterium]